MTTIYMIRHGESQANEINAFLGHGDLDLTALGEKQAEMTAEFLSDIKVDKIYSSDLKRAYRTAKFTAEKVGLEIEKNPLIREIDAGDWDQVPFRTILQKDEIAFTRWLRDLGNARPTNGESVAELQKRVASAMRDIAEKNTDKTVFVFSHATPIRAFSGYVMGKSLDELHTVPWATNASITKFGYEDGKFSLIEYSYDKHMGNAVTALHEED